MYPLRMLAVVVFNFVGSAMAYDAFHNVSHLSHPLGGNCTQLAAKGECEHNPVWMHRHCRRHCPKMRLRNLEHNCTTMVEAGRCTSDREWMMIHCNASCMPRFEEEEVIFQFTELDAKFTSSIASVVVTGYFVSLIFLVLLCCGGGGSLERMERVKVRLRKAGQAGLAGLLERLELGLGRCWDFLEQQGIIINSFGKAYICGFFILEGGWLIKVAALGILVGHVGRYSVTALMLYMSVEGAVVTLQVVDGGELNENMVKKMGMLGCVALLITDISQQVIEKELGLAAGTAGDLIAAQYAETDRQGMHVPRLVARLMISALFIVVAMAEIREAMSGESFDAEIAPAPHGAPLTKDELLGHSGVHFTNHHHPGEHEVLWPKVVEVVLSVPFILGFKTVAVSRLLSASLILEALTERTFWRRRVDMGDANSIVDMLHARDQFATNMAIAGGMLLMQKMGGGKYSVDEFLSKKSN